MRQPNESAGSSAVASVWMSRLDEQGFLGVWAAVAAMFLAVLCWVA